MKEQNEHYLKQELYSLVKNSDSIFEFLISGSLDGIWYWNLENPVDEWMSPRFWEVLGYDPKDKKHLSSEWQDIINQDDLKIAIENFQLHCDDPQFPYDQIVRYKHRDGSTVWIRCRGIAIRDENGKAVRMLGAHNDVTSLKNAEFKSYHDELTSLYNRYFLFEELSNMLHLAIRRQEPLSLIMIDIDDFKKINDNHGHLYGDGILNGVAKVILESTRGGDICARYGGEEFVILLPNTDVDDSIEVAERIRKSIEQQVWDKVAVRVSVGVSTFIKQAGDDHTVSYLGKVLLSHADIAMYKGKKNGKNQVIHHAR
ncbi:sensor domain-containing diguanylate cyclase [Vibrio sp. SCSIO 43137]|uniref:sensor domain-containing diguanylate cyclase n=1 Tax=Vibrio sp. SCSIO 43137 TaxID=3021011 RepID=UPI002307A676|nr:sensor domain-containing diguanylate cyclase [Vibrio sp. SCSIO 43137]WCE30817.1 sensor domain-containing diguanylate cyclase [Vibrio sp. SCSIO 43137]